ncbi:hypothetical protein J2Z40_002332 [Cytobacillus eiseniae]|uniref:Uncharacterized protein n=1 Tax=Cytobacillus eiseniae TaxID=762947 RepID=A0ABS4RFS8_9BACI|nr:hypothetical protein [Cytobacillus eiseniae]MBP2241760.1 hypothetical protein [Cytobacillus eiseniae]
MLKKQCVKYFVKYKGLLQNERGAQTLEWVAVGAVVVTIAALLGTAFKDSTGISDIVTAIITKIKDSI